MTRTLRSARAALIVAALVTIAPTQARAAAKPDERAAAQAFADAALHYGQDVRAALPAARKARQAARVDARKCDGPLRALERRLEGDGDFTRRDFRAFILMSIQPWVGVYATLVPAHERMLAELDATPTADPALRTGRAVWRSLTNLMRFYALIPADLCGQLDAWVDAGAKGTPLPDVNLRGWDDPEELDRDSSSPDESARLARAVRRLRELGQGPRRSERFDGEEAFAPLEPLFREIARTT